MKIQANGISMNYQVKGKGAELVLIHGAADNLNMWYHQIPFFSKSYRVITYDVRGSGESEGPESGEYSISVFAEDAYQLMKAIGVANACFIGYSMGGSIALELAIDHPELVKALVLANSSVGSIPPPTETLEQRWADLELLEEGDIKRFAEMMTNGAFSPGFKSKHPEEFRKYLEVKLTNRADGLARIIRGMAAPSNPPDLSRLKCPVLIVEGEHDRISGVESGRRAQAAIANSKMVVLPTGHAAAIELPEEFNAAVLEFLSEVS